MDEILSLFDNNDDEAAHEKRTKLLTTFSCHGINHVNPN
jgi:hypothetical protein